MAAIFDRLLRPLDSLNDMEMFRCAPWQTLSATGGGAWPQVGVAAAFGA
jgi:hypothetical protein